MATIQDLGSGQQANLCTALGGNVVTTNIVQRRSDQGQLRPAMLRIATTAGTTVTYLVEGSPDGVVWFSLPTQDITLSGAPGALTSAAQTVTTTTVTWKLLPVDSPWTYLRVTMSANTGCTATIDVFIY